MYYQNPENNTYYRNSIVNKSKESCNSGISKIIGNMEYISKLIQINDQLTEQ